MSKINIDADVVNAIDLFLGVIIRQVPNLAAAALSIKALMTKTDITADEMAQHHANLEAADKALGDAIAKRLGTP